jgi:hypothetical protein
MSDPKIRLAYGVELVLKAAQSRAGLDANLAARSIRLAMDAVRPRAINSLEIEHAQALAYLSLDSLYDALKASSVDDDLWIDCLHAVRNWRRLVDPGTAVDQEALTERLTG